MNSPDIISIYDQLADVPFLPDRKPILGGGDSAFTHLSNYRDSEIWVGHYAGNGEWERHPKGEEIVQVLEGETTLILLEGNQEVRKTLKRGQFIIVPQNQWHRFETPNRVSVMTVTPQPSDHQEERPTS